MPDTVLDPADVAVQCLQWSSPRVQRWLCVVGWEVSGIKRK